MKVNLKLNKACLVMICIASLLTLIVIYQAFIINKLRSTQTTQFFLESKLVKEQSTANTLKVLKNLIDDENVSKENKDIAMSNYMNIALAANYETKIEMILKSKGYEDVLASVSDDKVRVIIKSNKRLNKNQLNEIYDVVESITKIKNVDVDII